MSDFDDRPLAVGTITGLRSFKVDSLGRLTGVSYPEPWKPGTNRATCHVNTEFGRSLQRLQAGIWSLVGFLPAAPEPVSLVKHRVAQLGCGCGYWAYFDRNTNSHHREGQVLGIIEGFGTVTVGTRGFRAEKARLVGLVDESQQPSSWIARATIRFWLQLATVLAVLGCAAWFFATSAWVAAGCETAWGCVLTWWLVYCARKLNYIRPLPTSLINHLVRRNYPDVVIYPSVEAALAAHPLIKPPPLTPDNDPDFWTRSAS
jgi:mannose-6-phosphate isomerase-like protein (cupin superfamily)